MVTNGMLFMVLVTVLLTLPHRVDLRSIWVMVALSWLTWMMALSEVANSWWGAALMLPITAHQASATGGEPWQEIVVSSAHIGAGVALILAWTMLLFNFTMHPCGATRPLA